VITQRLFSGISSFHIESIFFIWHKFQKCWLTLTSLSLSSWLHLHHQTNDEKGKLDMKELGTIIAMVVSTVAFASPYILLLMSFTA